MIALISVVLTLVASLLIFATIALAIQAIGVMTGAGRAIPVHTARPRLAVLVPAHNEAESISQTVRHLLHEIRPDDRLIVIADNCTDDTASIARNAGAEVLIRTNTERRGKGFALAAGLELVGQGSAKANAAEVIVFVDADCRFEPGGLNGLARACAALQAPIQCRNLMTATQGVGSRLGDFASRIRNDFRPAGYAGLGLPCQLFGTGMALPAHLARAEIFATAHVTEDLLIGIECALAGSPPRYLRSVVLHSHFPETVQGCQQQKKRWVHGHLAIIASGVPRLLWHALRRRNLSALAMALDIAVPPLTLLAALHMGVGATALVWWLVSGSVTPLMIASLGLALLLLPMVAAWRFSGRDLIGTRELAALPRHAAGVIASVFSFASGRRSGWVRADRTRLG